MRRFPTGVLFVAPAVLLFSIFTAYALISGIALSFCKADFMSREFIGFANYIELFTDPRFYLSLKNTFYFSILCIPTSLGLAVAASMMAFRLKKFYQDFLRISLYLPVIASGVILALVWRMIFSPASGVLNQIIMSLGGKRVMWLGSYPEALFSVSMVYITQGIGESFLLLTAALCSIPSEQIDATKLEGASVFQEARYVLIPNVLPILAYLTIMKTIGVFQAFESLWILTGGGPNFKTTTMIIEIYRKGILYGEYGRSATQSVILFIIIVTFSLIQKRYIKRK